jgi:hypothetical protein
MKNAKRHFVVILAKESKVAKDMPTGMKINHIPVVSRG